ncbi:MAG: hypothetical protein DMG14_13340 [Acidobacteria bacterium]|nr:MAG: hypothetical protein DMG14_13340 [Acidobacteriota bacterium]
MEGAGNPRSGRPALTAKPCLTSPYDVHEKDLTERGFRANGTWIGRPHASKPSFCLSFVSMLTLKGHAT